MRAVFTDYTDYHNGYIEEHNPPKVAVVRNKEDIIRMYECPTSYVTMDTINIVQLVYMIDSTGHLLYEGGLANQPYWLIEAMDIYKRESSLKWQKEN